MSGSKGRVRLKVEEERLGTGRREEEGQPVEAWTRQVPMAPELLNDPRLWHSANAALRASLAGQLQRQHGNAVLQDLTSQDSGGPMGPCTSRTFTGQAKEAAARPAERTGSFSVTHLTDGAALSFSMDAVLTDGGPAGAAEEGEAERTSEGEKEPVSLPPSGSEVLEDRIGAEVGVYYTIRQGGSTRGCFGLASRHVSWKSWAARKKEPGDPSARYYRVKTRVSVRYMWNTAALGRKHISGPHDSNVTEDSWSQVVYDLTPSPMVPCRSPRVEYWCRDLTARHEQFHIHDWVGAFQRFRPLAQTWLETNSVTSTAEALSRANQSVSLLTSLVDLYMGSGDSAPCEVRAYADGAVAYRERARAVEERGKREGWSPGLVIESS